MLKDDGCFRKVRINHGFTIVELLIVIVVIGILAAITLISFSNISQRAIIASIQSDLKNAATKFKMYQIDNGAYPTAVDCSASPAANSTCLKASGDNNFAEVQANNFASNSSFCINVSNGDNYYYITDKSGPASGTCPADSANYIATGYQHTCALSVSNKIYCWGYNPYGQLGNGTYDNESSVPVEVDASQANSSLYGKTITAIAAGEDATCALDSEGQVHCWGIYIGDGGTTTPVPYPKHINGGTLANKTVVAIAVLKQARGIYALDSEGKLHSWGQNTWGWLGDGSGSSRYIPGLVETVPPSSLNSKTVTAISAGNYFACALDSEGYVHCWGYGAGGRLGIASSNSSGYPHPTAVNTDSSSSLNGKTVTTIAASLSSHACVIDSERHMHCWGEGSNGQLGNDGTTDKSRPVAVDTSVSSGLHNKSVVSIAVSNYSSCAKTTDGTIYCWGRGNEGQLGNIGFSNNHIPSVPVSTVSGVSSLYGKTVRVLAGGGVYHCAVDTLGQPHCWGSNNHGQIGNGNTTNQQYPYGVVLP